VADDLRERVRQERRARGWSARDAANAGHISNTTWGRWEKGEIPLTPKTTRAIATAFDWPTTWPTDPPIVTPQPDAVAALQRQVAALIEAVDLLTSTVRTQGAELERLAGRRLQR
jgi:transcriptional regulator with XRE-family HTH domain